MKKDYAPIKMEFVYGTCLYCKQQIGYDRPRLSLMYYPLPSGWSTARGIGEYLLCPKCGDQWDKNHKIGKYAT